MRTQKPFNQKGLDAALADFDRKLAAGQLDGGPTPELPELTPAPTRGEQTAALLLPARGAK